MVESPNIVLIVVDGLRGDEPILGGPLGTAALINPWLQRGRCFSNCRTVCGSPLPALVSMLTGQLPATRRVFPAGRSIRPPMFTAAFEKTHQRCLIHQLDDWPDGSMGVAGGGRAHADFDRVTWFPPNAPESLFAAAANCLRGGDDNDSRPQLLVVQTSTLRGCMADRPPYRAESTFPCRATYDRRVQELDRRLAGLLAAISLERTVVVVVGSHGQGFRPELGRLGHGGRLHDDVLRVPLVIWAPPGSGIEPGRDVRICSTLDIAPTLLGLSGHSGAGFSGQLLTAAARAPHRILEFEEWRVEEGQEGADLADHRCRLSASLIWPLKQIRTEAAGGQRNEWFNLAADPEEERELLGQPPAADLPSLSIVVVVDDRREFEMHIGESPLFTGGRHQWILMDNSNNRISADICRIYAEAAMRAEGHLLMFAHQDVFFPPGWEQDFARALTGLERLDADWGVIGSVGVPVDTKSVGGWRSVGHWASPAGYGRTDPLPALVQSLDEQWLCVRRDSRLGFDPKLPGFHGYGVDICLAAAARGMGCYAIDAFVWHKYRGPDGRLVQSPEGCRKILRRQRPEFIAEVQAGYRYVGEKWLDRIPFFSTSMAWTDPNRIIFTGPRARFEPSREP